MHFHKPAPDNMFLLLRIPSMFLKSRKGYIRLPNGPKLALAAIMTLFTDDADISNNDFNIIYDALQFNDFYFTNWKLLIIMH